MTILSQRGVIRLLALSSLLILPGTTGAQQRAPIVESSPRSMVSSRLGRSKRSAIPLAHRLQDSICFDHGPGSPKPTRSPMRGKISQASP